MATIDLKKQERNIEVNVRRKIKDEMLTKQYFVAELVKKALDKYLKFEDMVADNSNSIYTLPLINEDLCIIDFEINSLSVHVIPTFDKAKNVNVYIPAIYKQYHYKPDMFLFVNFSKSFTKMEIIGYITETDFQNTAIPKAVLLSPDNFVETLKTIRPRQNKISTSTLDTTKELMLAYLERDLSEEGIRFFFKNLLLSTEVRKNYKLFYELNCDFISIAKNKSIEKFNPDETKIELHSRSDYFMDKAISKYNLQSGEQPDVIDQITDEEFVAGLYAHQDSLDEQENTLVDADNEKVLELSLEPLNIRNEDNDADEVAENIESNVSYGEQPKNFANDNSQKQEDDTNEEEDEETVTQDNINIESGIEEPVEESAATLNDNVIPESYQEDETNNTTEDESFLQVESHEDTSFDLSASEPELEDEFVIDDRHTDEDIPSVVNRAPEMQYEAPEEPMLSEEDNTLSSVDDMNYEELPKEDDMSFEDILPESDIADLAEDEDILSALDEDDYSHKEIELQDNQNAQEEINSLPENDSDDDVFAFLSEIADESESSNTVESTNVSQDNQPLQQENYDVHPQMATSQEPSQSEFQQNDFQQNQFDNQFDNQFAQQETQVSQQYAQSDSSQVGTSQVISSTAVAEKPKTNPKFIIGAFLLIIGLGVYQYKDKIPFLNGNSAPVADNEVALDETIPSPIDAAKLENNTDGATSQTVDTPQAPAPSTTDNSAENVPSASDNAKTIPALPTTTVEPPKPKHLNDAIATALTKDFNGVRISKLSWEISETLVNKPDVKRYLTIAGKSIKNALAQDLMSATEPSFKDSIVVNIVYKKDGTISKVDVASSSGSKQIDDIVVKSVRDTLSYIKMPALNLKTPEYTAKIVVRL